MTNTLRSIVLALAVAAMTASAAHAQTATKPAPTTTAPAKTPAATPAPTPAPAPAATAAKPADLIDVNSASQGDLEKLWGVGPVRAKAIIAGRPYKGKDELLSKKLVPQNVYDKIKDQIIARQK